MRERQHARSRPFQFSCSLPLRERKSKLIVSKRAAQCCRRPFSPRNLFERGLGNDSVNHSYLLGILAENSLMHMQSQLATYEDTYFLRISKFNFWFYMVWDWFLLPRREKLWSRRSELRSGPRRRLDHEVLAPENFGGAPKIRGGFTTPSCRALSCLL
jgi:hypothetical protein